MKAFLIGLGIAASLAVPLAQARDCGCADLPAMVTDLTQHEFLQKLFQGYADYMPRGIQTPADVQARAQAQFNEAFYPKNGAVAGTAHGGHAALGTDLNDPKCPIVMYLYDKKGQPLRDKDGRHRTKPVTERTYKTQQCSGRTRADFAHERAHVANCLKLVETNRTHLWDSPEFFARDDANAYRVGADALRSEIGTLARNCGWDSSTRNRLPNREEAEALAKQAAKARPSRNKKK